MRPSEAEASADRRPQSGAGVSTESSQESAGASEEQRPTVAAQRLIDDIHGLAAEYLLPQIKRLRAREHVPGQKVINDTLWGSIRLARWEVAILDTYLLQRLRYLRQLGVAHWIYPAAGHSRLEHSLGVLHQMGALLEGLERGSGTAGTRVVDNVTAQLLKIAALVHDCGHTVMSHVSEPILYALPGMKDLLGHLKKKFRARGKGPKPSEAIAATMVQSAAFQELLSVPSVGADFIKDVATATHQIAGFILGGPVVAENAFLTLLMTGAYDADKLDYMPRDARMAGIPCAVDVGRVIETLRVLEVPREKIPPDYAKWAGCEGAKTVRVVSLTSAGARALNEIAITRTLLYEKIYYHHKARALEAMVRRALESEPPTSIRKWMDLSDDAMISPGTSKAFSYIRSRDLLKRAFVISAPSGPDDQSVEEQNNQRQWRQITGNLDAFRKRLQEVALKAAKILDVGVDTLLEQPVEVDFPSLQKFELDQYAFVGDTADGFEKANVALSGQRSEAGKRAAAHGGYVFAPESGVLAAFLATRWLLASEYSLHYAVSSYIPGRLDPEVVDDADRKLRDGKFYASSTVLPGLTTAGRLTNHRKTALETFLKSAWPRIEALGVRFGRYQAENGEPVSPASIAQFLRQFAQDRLARPALRVLEAVDFKDRRYFVNALTSHLRLLVDDGGVDCVCPLGATGDSSSFLYYLMNDLPKELHRPVKPLEMALDDDRYTRLALWDDFCGAGGHSITAICQWMGLTDNKVLNEPLVEPLSSERVEKLRQRTILLTYAAARASGIDEMRRFAERHGLTNLRIREEPIEVIPEKSDILHTSVVIPDSSERESLREFLCETAERILLHKTTRVGRPWTPTDLKDRLLGYGNGCHALVFFYNVPTITLTPLWQGDPTLGSWKPLFQRRAKAG